MPRLSPNLPTVPKAVITALGKAIALARQQKKWSQTTLAERVGVSRQKIARLEHGDPKIDIGTLVTSAWLLNVPLINGIDFTAAKTKDFLTLLIGVLDDQLAQKASTKLKFDDGNF